MNNLERFGFYLIPIVALLSLSLIGLSWFDSTAGYRDSVEFNETSFGVLNAALFVSEQLESGEYEARQIDASLEEILEFDPLDPLVWALRAEVSAEFENESIVKTYIERAETLGGSRWHVRARLVKAWLKLGDPEKAYANARDVTQLFPPAIAESLRALRESGADSTTLVDIFTSKDVDDGYQEYFREKRLLAFARKEGDRSLEDTVWEESDAGLRELSGAALSYLNSSYATSGRVDMLTAWRRVMKIDRERDAIWNGGFELPLENLPLTWVVDVVDGVNVYVDKKTSYRQNNSVSIVFDGTKNVDYYHFRQRVPVTGAGTYELKLFWRGRKLTTESGVFFEVYGTAAPKNGGGYRSIAKSTTEIRTWSWKQLSIVFEVSSDIDYVEVRLSRKKSSSLNSKISGRVWIDEVALERKP